MGRTLQYSRVVTHTPAHDERQQEQGDVKAGGTTTAVRVCCLYVSHWRAAGAFPRSRHVTKKLWQRNTEC